jgi:hypothetical protein
MSVTSWTGERHVEPWSRKGCQRAWSVQDCIYTKARSHHRQELPSYGECHWPGEWVTERDEVQDGGQTWQWLSRETAEGCAAAPRRINIRWQLGPLQSSVLSSALNADLCTSRRKIRKEDEAQSAILRRLIENAAPVSWKQWMLDCIDGGSRKQSYPSKSTSVELSNFAGRVSTPSEMGAW